MLNAKEITSDAEGEGNKSGPTCSRATETAGFRIRVKKARERSREGPQRDPGFLKLTASPRDWSYNPRADLKDWIAAQTGLARFASDDKEDTVLYSFAN